MKKWLLLAALFSLTAGAQKDLPLPTKTDIAIANQFARFVLSIESLSRLAVYGTGWLLDYDENTKEVTFVCPWHVVKSGARDSFVARVPVLGNNPLMIRLDSHDPTTDLAIGRVSARDALPYQIEMLRRVIGELHARRVQRPVPDEGRVTTLGVPFFWVDFDSKQPRLLYSGQGILQESRREFSKEPSAVVALASPWISLPIPIIRTPTCPQPALTNCYLVNLPTQGFSGGMALVSEDLPKQANDVTIAGMITHFTPWAIETHVVPFTQVLDAAHRLLNNTRTKGAGYAEKFIYDSDQKTALFELVNDRTVKILANVSGLKDKLVTSSPLPFAVAGGAVSGGGGDPSPGGGDPSPGGGDPSPGGGDPSPGGGDPSPGGGDPSPGGPAITGKTTDIVGPWLIKNGSSPIFESDPYGNTAGLYEWEKLAQTVKRPDTWHRRESPFHSLVVATQALKGADAVLNYRPGVFIDGKEILSINGHTIANLPDFIYQLRRHYEKKSNTPPQIDLSSSVPQMPELLQPYEPSAASWVATMVSVRRFLPGDQIIGKVHIDLRVQTNAITTQELLLFGQRYVEGQPEYHGKKDVVVARGDGQSFSLIDPISFDNQTKILKYYVPDAEVPEKDIEHNLKLSGGKFFGNTFRFTGQLGENRWGFVVAIYDADLDVYEFKGLLASFAKKPKTNVLNEEEIILETIGFKLASPTPRS